MDKKWRRSRRPAEMSLAKLRCLMLSPHPTQSVSVTAVPDEGYVFVKWSDGVTDRTRTDTGFKQNLDVTAVFSAVSVQISSDGKGF